MKKKILLFVFANLFIWGVQSCQQESDDVFTPIENEQDSLTPKRCVVNLNVQIDEFDRHNTRSTSANWNNGDKIYLTFGNGAYGAAEYKNDEWIMEYFGKLITDSTAKCSAVYFENIEKAINFSTVCLTDSTIIYEDQNAEYYFSDNMLGVKAKLQPKTGRMRFKGTPNDTIQVYGISALVSYSVYKKDFTTQKAIYKLVVGNEGYTPYVYGIFADSDSRRLNVITKHNAFNRVFADSVMANGVSGYLDIPTEASHRGWARNIICKVGNCEFTMIPLIMNDTIAYFMGETEVTEALYAAVENNTTTKPNTPKTFYYYSDIEPFISKLNKTIDFIFRIPTKEEWQYAAKGGNKSQNCIYSGSDIASDVAWYSPYSESKIHEVAQLMPNELGFYDMSGNLSEWTSTKYSSRNYYYYCGGNYSQSEEYCKVIYSSYDSYQSYCGLRLALSIN